jgi:hypothetical protein
MKTRKLINLVLLIFLFSCGSEDKRSIENSVFGQGNAIWAESIYLRGYNPSSGEILTNERLKKYAHILKSNNIKYIYLFAGPFLKDGHLPDYPFSNIARNSVKKLEEYYPELIILPWVGGIQNKTVYLGDSIWVKNALNDTKRLVETLDIPGVHIDFEYILKGDPYLDTTIEPEKPHDKEMYAGNVNSFFIKLRGLLPKSFISTVVVATSPDTKPWKRKTTIEELDILVKYINQLSFLYYDTHINSEDIFERNCIKQIMDIKTLKRSNTNTQFLLAIGTFINRPELTKYRNLKIESIPNSLKVIKESALKVSVSEKLVNGIAIFCDWETDKSEWREFYTNWITQP